MGTHWAGDDGKAQDKYVRGKQAAEKALAKDKLKGEKTEASTATSCHGKL